MAEFEVRLPDLVETSGDKDAGTSAKVSFVYVDAGDQVDEGADLVELVTDKATFNVPSPKAGKVKRVVVGESDTVNVGDIICVLEV